MIKATLTILLTGAFPLGGCAQTRYRASKIGVRHPSWDDSVVGKVARRRVRRGMRAEMVRAAMGIPDSMTRAGDEEKWGYAVYTGDYQPGEEMVFFVYFKYGVVTRTAGDRDRLKTFSRHD